MKQGGFLQGHASQQAVMSNSHQVLKTTNATHPITMPAGRARHQSGARTVRSVWHGCHAIQKGCKLQQPFSSKAQAGDAPAMAPPLRDAAATAGCSKTGYYDATLSHSEVRAMHAQ